jgi:hypothetical protein
MNNTQDIDGSTFAPLTGSALLVGIADDATDAQIEETAFRSFAYLHPHEAYATWPDRFWGYFQTMAPGKTREEMETLLRETEREAAQNGKLCDSDPSSGGISPK